MKLRPLPNVRGMIMAIRTLQLDPQEDTTRFGSDLFGICALSENQCSFRMFFHVSGGSQHVGHSGIPTLARVPLGRHPRFKLVLIESRSLFRGP